MSAPRFSVASQGQRNVPRGGQVWRGMGDEANSHPLPLPSLLPQYSISRFSSDRGREQQEGEEGSMDGEQREATGGGEVGGDSGGWETLHPSTRMSAIPR